MVIMQKKEYIGMKYNTNNIQMLCIINLSYSTFNKLKTHVRSDQSDQKNKLELFITNWSYYYKK